MYCTVNWDVLASLKINNKLIVLRYTPGYQRVSHIQACRLVEPFEWRVRRIFFLKVALVFKTLTRCSACQLDQARKTHTIRLLAMECRDRKCFSSQWAVTQCFQAFPCLPWPRGQRGSINIDLLRAWLFLKTAYLSILPRHQRNPESKLPICQCWLSVFLATIDF